MTIERKRPIIVALKKLISIWTWLRYQQSLKIGFQSSALRAWGSDLALLASFALSMKTVEIDFYWGPEVSLWLKNWDMSWALTDRENLPTNVKSQICWNKTTGAFFGQTNTICILCVLCSHYKHDSIKSELRGHFWALPVRINNGSAFVIYHSHNN